MIATIKKHDTLTQKSRRIVSAPAACVKQK